MSFKTLINGLLIFAIVAAISVAICFAIVVKSINQRDAARTSERAARTSEKLAWEKVHELRATMAAQGLLEQF